MRGDEDICLRINVLLVGRGILFWRQPYTLEVPVNNIRAVKIPHPLRAVDKLQDLSVPVRRHEEPSRTNCIR